MSSKVAAIVKNSGGADGQSWLLSSATGNVRGLQPDDEGSFQLQLNVSASVLATHEPAVIVQVDRPAFENAPTTWVEDAGVGAGLVLTVDFNAPPSEECSVVVEVAFLPRRL